MDKINSEKSVNKQATEKTTTPETEASLPQFSGRKPNLTPGSLINLQKTVGNQQVLRLLGKAATPQQKSAEPSQSKPIQRAIINKSDKTAYARSDFEEDGKFFQEYEKLNFAKKLLVDIVLETASPIWEVDPTRANHLTDFANFNFDNPPPEFIDALEINQVQALLTSKKLNLSSKLIKALESRRTALVKAAAPKMATATLHTPTLPPGVNGASAKDTEIQADLTGQRDRAFLKAKNDLPGKHGNTTSAVNMDLSHKLIDNNNYEQVGEQHVSVCPGCAQTIDVLSFEVDHQVAFSQIRNTLSMLAAAMSIEKKVLKQVEKELGPKYDLYFGVDSKKNLYPTAAALKEYSNDTTNLMELCRQCNGATGKTDINYLQWYRDNPLYGPAFVETHHDVNQNTILPRTKTGLGWGEAARDWFNIVHMPILKQLISLEQNAEPFREFIRQEDSSKYTSKYSTTANPDEKKQAAIKGENLANLNATYNASVVSNKRHFEDIGKNANDEDELENFTPHSPKRIENLTKEVFDKRKQQKKQELTTNSPHAQQGFEDARMGKDETVYPPTDIKNSRDYKIGYEQGLQKQAEDSQAGYKDGVLGIDKDANLEKYPFYSAGYEKGKNRLQEVTNHGLNLGRSNQNIDPGFVNLTELESSSLMQTYMVAYNQGRQTT